MTVDTTVRGQTDHLGGGSSVRDLVFASMGTTVRLRGAGAEAACEEVLDAARRLTRFAPSELTALNEDPRDVVPVSPLLRDAVAAALHAARATDGLVTPCVLDALEAAGYDRTFALMTSPSRRRPSVPPGDRQAIDARTGPVRPPGDRKAVELHADAVRRPPGLRLDLGGTAKGLLADRLAHLEVADLGGDVRVRGTHQVLVAHPRGGLAARLVVTDAAVATSSVAARAWPGGHHLIDPATGTPAATRLLQVTAIAASALEAEWRAKAALLTGDPVWLGDHGGVLVHRDGRAERIG